MFKTPPVSSQKRFGSSVSFPHSPESPNSSTLHDNKDIEYPMISNDTFDKKLTNASLKTPETPHECILQPISPVSALSSGSTRVSTSTSVRAPLSFINTSINQLSSPLTSPVSPRDHEFSSSSSTPVETPISVVSINDYNNHLPHSSVYSQDEILTLIENSVIDSSFGFKLEKLIGQGSFSNVFSCRIGERALAIKLAKSKRNCKPIFRELINYKIIEQNVQLSDFENIPILNIMGITFLEKSHYSKIRHGESLPGLISEHLHSNLEELVRSKSSSSAVTSLRIGSSLWWKLAKQLLTGLIILRKCSLIHLDLKPQNILYDQESQDFKIADFTSAGLYDDIMDKYSEMISNDSFFDVTLQYCAPELVKSPPSSPSFDTDLYAVGLILLNAATGKEPYYEALNSVSSPSRLIYLNECIKKNKVLDLLSYEELQILQNNKEAYDLLKLIILERSSLKEIVDHVSRY